MFLERILNKMAWGLSLLLGQASAILGLVITVGWTFAFVMALPNKAGHWASGPHALLPIGPPLIGLALGGLGLLIARWGRVPIARFSVAGLILNTLPLALALLLLALRASA